MASVRHFSVAWETWVARAGWRWNSCPQPASFESLCLPVVLHWWHTATSGSGNVSANYVENCWKTFLFCCCLEPYKLVTLKTTETFGEIKACRKACRENGMVLMPLDSEYDRKAIVNLPWYKDSSVVITDAIEIVDNSGSSTFFSSPGGKQVTFIHLFSTIGKRQSNTPGTYSIVIYHGEYYSRESVVGKDYECACKLPGEQYLYNRHSLPNKRLGLRKTRQISFLPPLP